MAAYLAIAQRDPRRVAPVDAADGIPKVQQKIFRVIEERLFPALSLNKKS
jgi:thymidylate kinase